MKIGITYTGSDEKQLYYHQWLAMGNTLCELVTLHGGDGLPDLSQFAGIVFSGGIDIDPSFYNGCASYPGAPDAFNTARDRFEKELYFAATAAAIPILGICRGMQLINVLHGGTLIQDLGEANSLHRAMPGDKKHLATVDRGTMLMQILQHSPAGSAIAINSAHHQVIERVGDNLRISCRSEDGVPEALEQIIPGPSFMLGVQWHPERMFRFGLENDAACIAVRDSFLAETNKYNLRHENN